VLVSNYGSLAIPDTGRTISVLLGNGDGTLGPRMSFETGLGPYWLEVEDLNGDGHEDVAVQNSASGSVSILLGHGDGSFSPRSDYKPSAHGGTLAMGDLDEDGALDIAVDLGRNQDSVTILHGSGDGTFTPLPPTALGTFLALAGLEDLNLDGHLDMLVFGYYANALRILRGRGDGTFERQPFDFGLGSAPDYPTFADFNADGLLDVVTANHFLNDLSVLLNTTPVAPVSVPQDPVARTPGALRILPNPARGELGVEFTLPGKAPARLELFDVSGRRLGSREVGALGAGVHRVRLSQGASLRAGIYFVRLRESGRARTVRAAVLD
jgi:hypothetical protein